MPCKLMLCEAFFFCPAGIDGAKKGEKVMFQTKLDECGFTLLTSGLMIYIMGVYNVAPVSYTHLTLPTIYSV